MKQKEAAGNFTEMGVSNKRWLMDKSNSFREESVQQEYVNGQKHSKYICSKTTAPYIF
ncbi:hypothetical protein X953_19010 [Virgibacillus sp. SK37]|nr:hypothetical protein X953_19010 [Virgibacillus sp. SK37]